jgi:hypothetical protein
LSSALLGPWTASAICPDTAWGHEVRATRTKAMKPRTREVLVVMGILFMLNLLKGLESLFV